MLKNIFLIVIAVLFGIIVLQWSNKQDEARGRVYDGCYEQYTAHKIPAENFVSFMQNCQR